jgi:hypothetical protein
MPLDPELARLARARAQERLLAERERAAEERLRAAEDERERLLAGGSREAVIEAQERRAERLAAAREEARRRLMEARERAREERERAARPEPEQAIGTLDGQVPIALLPVRIETRYADAGTTLHIRIFPDQIHVDAHEPELTADEVAAGRAYWEQRWPEPDDDARADAAWTAIASVMRPNRARWIVEVTRPTNTLGAAGGPDHRAVATRPAAWTRPARAAALPARWVAIGMRGGREVFRAWSDPVREGLEVAPAPNDETAMTDAAALGEGLRWLAELTEARAAGVVMTVRDADLGGGMRLADGLDQLIVLGVDWTRTPEAAADELTRLLAAHVYGDGLAFVAQGTPTNNTSDVPSGHTSDAAVLAAALDPARPAELDPVWAAGARLAGALGLGDVATMFEPASGGAAPDPAAPGAAPDPGAVLRATPGAARAEHAVSSALLDATWEATAGTYLGQVIRPYGRMRPPVTDDEIDQLRVWAASNVFASGPLPAIRVGRQPYGLLPVVDPTRYAPRPGDRAAELVRAATARLRPWWTRATAAVPRLDGASDLDAALLALLQRSPVATVARFRRVIPLTFLTNVGGFGELSSQQGLHAWLVASMFEGRPAEQLPRLSTWAVDPRDHALRIPWVRPAGLEPGAPLPWVADLRATLGTQGARDRLAARTDATSLGEAVVALSAALELDAAHGRVVRGLADRVGIVSSMSDGVRLQPDTIGIGGEPATDAGALVFASPKELADAVVPDLTGTRSVADHVSAELAELIVAPDTRPGLDGLRRLVDALDRLMAEPGERVDWAFRGLLDLYAYRLDAWQTALATERLASQRAARPKGIHLGCIGWVEDLAPDPAERDSLGYVHTPSLGHAVTAAVLRSGHVAHRGDGESPFAIDLSARRVRRAMAVLDGVESGQPLGALLGYRLERSLRDRDAALARYILPLRQLAPLRHTDAALSEPVESIAAHDVVDAVALLDRWRANGGRDDVFATAGIQDNDRVAVAAVIDEVDDVLDAVADVLVSETVYQTVVGNPERARAALAALDRQERPVSPDVVRTPRTGTTVTHRVLVLLGDGPAPGWEDFPDPRSTAEPRLNAWVARLLGPPGSLVFGAEVRRAGTVRTTVSATAAELGLSPLALVLAARRSSGDRPSELESRLARVLAAKFTGAAEDDRLVLLGDPPADAGQGAWGLAAVGAVAGWLDRVIGGRSASGRDLGPLLDDAPSAGLDDIEIARRADAAEAELVAVDDALAAAADGPVVAVVAALDRAAAAGLPDALDEAAAVSAGIGTEAGDLASHAVARTRAAITAKRARLKEAAEAFVARSDPSLEATVEHHRQRLRTVLGDGFPALPVFRPEQPGALAASLADRPALLGEDDLAPLAWLHRAALVRPAVEHLSSLLTVAEASGRDVGLPHLDVAQLPHQPGQSWVALRTGGDGPSGRVGIVIHAPDGFDPGRPVAGLVVDEWTETIPGSVETTALSFHYDAPAARPPQAVVLAVTGAPDAATWTFDELLGVARETIALTRLRTVGPRELPDLGGFLPALYVPQDVTGDVPGVDLFDLVDRARVAEVVPGVLGKD